MNRYREYSDHQNSINLCSIEAGMGENFLALEGLELNIPVRTANREEALDTLWDDYFEEDITAMINNPVAQQ